jgi:hypothetical protein
MFSFVRRTTCLAFLAGGLLTASLLGGVALARQTQSGIAAIYITSPIGTPGKPQVLGADGKLLISIAVQNFTLDPSHIGTKVNTPGSGHYNVYVDGFDPAAPAKYLLLAGATPTILLSPVTLAKAEVSYGLHRLFVVLANNDNTLVKPYAITSTVIQVMPPASIAFTSPVGTIETPQLMSPMRRFSFTIATRNFTFDAAHNGSSFDKPGTGYYHVYIDSIDPARPSRFLVASGTSPNFQISQDQLGNQGVTSGTHTLFVALANNDHSLVQPLAIASTVLRLGPSLQVVEMAMPGRPLLLSPTGKITLHVTISNFALDPKHMNTMTNMTGSGHYQVYVDSFDPNHPTMNFVADSANPTLDVTAAQLAKVGVNASVHALYVMLAYHDRSLVLPLTGASTYVQIGS